SILVPGTIDIRGLGHDKISEKVKFATLKWPFVPTLSPLLIGGQGHRFSACRAYPVGLCEKHHVFRIVKSSENLAALRTLKTSVIANVLSS
ncbi:MAG: hypothetical protein KAU38_02755, partial [Desulfobacterales bacterium]|nr:hypothetical protein [Desulfobacterales bacterium]